MGYIGTNIRPDFIVGKVYSIKQKKKHNAHQKGVDLSGYDVEFGFCYEGKQGIHHVFREIHGGWTRTYADYQLIGKIIEVLEEQS